MVAIKRKADQGSTPSKKEKGASSDRSAKRRKSDVAAEPSPAKAKPESAAPKSVFKDEEKSFPRGGASVLTPLEHKQIQIKANQDVLFEQSGTKRTGGDDNDFSDMGSEDGEQARPKSAKTKTFKKGKKSHADGDEEQVIRAEGLSYKKLSPGTIILGQVTDITHQDIVLALPNNLVGYVPLTAVSDKLNERLEKLLKEEDADKAEGSDDEEAFEDVELKDMFFVGQYLRACITSTSDDTARAKKRLELSVDPKLVNKGLSKRKIPVNSMIQASVVSNEDHGLVMDLGLADPKLKGFLPKGELGPKIPHAKIQEGAVFMCLVTGLNSDGRIVKLSADLIKAGNLTKGNTMTEAPTIDVFLPGTAVDVLIADTTPATVTGKILGLIDATADAYHSGTTEKGADITKKYKIGSKVKGRILFTCPDSEPRKVGVSFLDHVVSLSTRMSGKPKERKPPLELLPISTIIESAKVIKVQQGHGAFFDLGVRDVVGFAHISRLADDKVDILSDDAGAFKLESKHRARIIGYNDLDGLFQLSLEQKVLDQPFLRIEDIKAGQLVKGKVHKLIADKTGATAVLVHLAEGITGLVPEMHLADVRLQHPERKFREGVPVTARVLYTEPARHQIQLTLKKSLVNSEVEPWTNFAMLSKGDTGPGILVNVRRNGATVRFYGDVKAWLPMAEMSEAYIEDATRHFANGQVVKVRVLSVDPGERQLLVSCKDPAAIDTNKEAAFSALNPGGVVKGTVIEKNEETATLDLGHGVKGLLRIGHLTDGSEKKDVSTMKKIRVGGTLDDLVVLSKHNKSRTAIVSNKPSLRKDAQASKLPTNVQTLQVGEIVHGFVRGILPDKVFVELGNGISGPVFKSQLTQEMLLAANFGLRKDQSVTVRVTHVDSAKGFFWLSMKLEPEADESATTKTTEATGQALVDPIDPKISSTADIKFGTTTTVRIRSVKRTQVNVELAENVQGRISVSEMFDSWDDIPDKKRPTAHFKMNDRIEAKVLGRHDARNHRFLPISHRSSNKTPTYEMTTKKDKIRVETDVLSLDKISPGSSHVAFVNNIADRYVWVNITANVRGRIDFFDLTDDLEQLSAIEENFPVGSALKVRVKAVDVAAGRLDLTAATTVTGKTLTLQDLKVGYILPARVTKLHETSIVVQINDNIAAPIYLEQLADDYDKAKPSEFKVGDVLRVSIIDVDVPNKKLGLSARPSRVLSSSLPVKDPEIKDKTQLKVHQVVRGFIKHVADNGVYVRLGPHAEAYVRISHLSDEYIKDWKSAFHVDQLVTGKIISNKEHMRNPQMSLKTSVIQGDYTEPLEFSDLQVGQIVTAKVRHVENFGVFLVVDNSNNVSGLCHISQLADKAVAQDKVKEMYKKDDVVKAKIVRVEPKTRKISFTLKYSQVKGEGEDEEMEDASDNEVTDEEKSDEGGVELDDDVEMRSVRSAESDDDDAHIVDADSSEEDLDQDGVQSSAPGLNTSGFDWTGATLDFDEQNGAAASDSDGGAPKKKKKSKKATIKEDRTGDLDAYGPQSVADYERLLLGQPNSAEMWVRYIVFQRELNEIDKARQIARRALATINPREEKEKLDVWTALLHLENDFASDDAMEEVFKEACQHNDAREVHERMIKIYIGSGKIDKADTLYQSMTKNKSFTPDPQFWLSYATFLMDVLPSPSPTRARALLQRATQSVASSQHRYLTQKFAALEFKSANGDAERGRTIFEGLVSTFPKKGDVWDVYLSQEMSHGSAEGVRDLFERMTKVGGKSKRAAAVYKKWAEWENSVGNAKGVERVKALAEQWREEKKGKADE
ncbi:rRNA biogenesis protein-like protein RRP5 [Cucurbitaria berberidis CBS 394.84]|uniref:rRNA biogenesis protein RRP5 n=1 Tax=Cucurbitaria berberidis CBS 394.84 TaxID=1168544 RepID=A0A9P4GJ53_9PLEO|nr:rRNA biogenesis protein-like protein RRP5 [Cucurbitaria berberidis CBS 394.84]KAF1847168.1 rRNA biogenesis protein-like protein RRP5 [Cucurbitaria berberidis CBS 394.84]